jgi:uncharacterized protein (TIGR02452 family)
MSARLRGIAKATEAIVAAGHYTGPAGRRVSIAEPLAAARAGTRMYGPEPVAVPERVEALERADAPVPGAGGADPAFEVTGEDSLRAARRLLDEDGHRPVAVLSFASARNPGGGYLNGAQAQEEALCRASALYGTLLCAPEYYAHHREERDPFYTDRVIHSPGVPVFRDERATLLDTPYEVGFLTSPAPNAGVILRQTPERVPLVVGALASRAGRVLEVAALHGYRRLVLGAWGCGVFRNDPAEVADAFHGHLAGAGTRFAGRFDQVVFAVLDRDPASRARAAFRTAFTAPIPS